MSAAVYSGCIVAADCIAGLNSNQTGASIIKCAAAQPYRMQLNNPRYSCLNNTPKGVRLSSQLATRMHAGTKMTERKITNDAASWVSRYSDQMRWYALVV